MTSTPETRNRSIAAKSSARLAAAQALYRLEMTQDTPDLDKLVADTIETAPLDDDEETAFETPDAKFLRKLLGGVIPERRALKQQVAQHLSTDWKIERMSPLLVAILILAAYELQQHTQLSIPVIVDEYVTLAGGFFGEREQGFVQGILHTLAGEIRG